MPDDVLKHMSNFIEQQNRENRRIKEEIQSIREAQKNQFYELKETLVKTLKNVSPEQKADVKLKTAKKEVTKAKADQVQTQTDRRKKSKKESRHDVDFVIIGKKNVSVNDFIKLLSAETYKNIPEDHKAGLSKTLPLVMNKFELGMSEDRPVIKLNTKDLKFTDPVNRILKLVSDTSKRMGHSGKYHITYKDHNSQKTIRQYAWGEPHLSLNNNNEKIVKKTTDKNSNLDAAYQANNKLEKLEKSMGNYLEKAEKRLSDAENTKNKSFNEKQEVKKPSNYQHQKPRSAGTSYDMLSPVKELISRGFDHMAESKKHKHEAKMSKQLETANKQEPFDGVKRARKNVIQAFDEYKMAHDKGRKADVKKSEKQFTEAISGLNVEVLSVTSDIKRNKQHRQEFKVVNKEISKDFELITEDLKARKSENLYKQIKPSMDGIVNTLKRIKNYLEIKLGLKRSV